MRVFKWDGISWNILTDSTGISGEFDGDAANDYFGNSVSLSGDGTVVAAGAIFNADAGYRAGHVKVYQYITTPPIMQNNVTITGTTLTDGTAILASGALTGNVIGTVFGELNRQCYGDYHDRRHRHPSQRHTYDKLHTI